MAQGNVEELPRAAWAAVFRTTIVFTLASMAVSLAVTTVILDTLSQGISAPGVAASLVMPILLGAPMIFYLTLSRQKLRHANRLLQTLAATDWLTGCLNRRAFTTQVSALLRTGPSGGALLVIDADHFKAINDRFGHDQGDEALQLMSGAIRSAMREGDLLGRMGGEEFAVFVKGADGDAATEAAEAIRCSVAALTFAPDGANRPLSVSVGGAILSGEVGFSELFRLADQRLYLAKHAGRNRVDLVAIGPEATVSSQAA